LYVSFDLNVPLIFMTVLNVKTYNILRVVTQSDLVIGTSRSHTM